MVRGVGCDIAETACAFPQAQRATLVHVRLLVVEDEIRMAGALQRGLQAEGFAVDVAGDGPTGLELARHGGYDAVILDIMLPGLSGYRVVRRCAPRRTGCRC